jgi:hypothetical protein
MVNMALLDALFGHKKREIKDLSLTELQDEKVRLEVEERKVNKVITRMEEDKGRLFKQGASEASQREKIILARKIKELDEEVKSQDRKAAMLSQQIRVVNRLVALKRKESELKEAGVWKMITEMDPAALDEYLNKGVIRDEQMAAKMQGILGVLESETGMSEIMKEDPETMRLVALMEQAGESGAIEEKLAEAEKILKKEKDSQTEDE